MLLIEALPPKLAAQPPGVAFLTPGWKRVFKGVLAEVDTYDS
ncbi:hypothetical protein [Nostoc sp.]